ncbi:MAG: amidohydrolase family protein, partial [Planctomycetota bacterium]
VTRTSAEGKTYGPEQRVTVLQAIRAWTLGSAYASFDERRKGTLAAGKLADFVILSADPRSVPPERIRHINVEATAVDGKIVYRSEAFDALSSAATQTHESASNQRPPLRFIGLLCEGTARENSGIVQSRTDADLFWMHNDSGDQPRIYPVRRDARVVGSERYGAFDAEQVEAVCFDGPDRILLADEATARLYEADVVDFEPVGE